MLSERVDERDGDCEMYASTIGSCNAARRRQVSHY